MKISKAKLVDGGLRGLEAAYTSLEVKDNFQFENEYTRKRKAPVPQELKDLFAKLKSHLMKICFIDENGEDDVEITGVSSNNDDQFLIMAKVRANELTNATFAVNTPLVKDDSGYTDFDDVIQIVSAIYTGVKKYFKEKEMADSKQIVMDLFNKDSDKVNEVLNKDLAEGAEPRQFTAADINKLADSELQPLIIAALERKGCMVMKKEEHETSNSDDDATEAPEAPAAEPERKRMAVAH